MEQHQSWVIWHRNKEKLSGSITIKGFFRLSSDRVMYILTLSTLISQRQGLQSPLHQVRGYKTFTFFKHALRVDPFNFNNLKNKLQPSTQYIH